MAANPAAGDKPVPTGETGVWVLLRKTNPDDYPPDSGMPAYAGAVLVGHIAAKTCEAGSVIGTLAALVNAARKAALGKEGAKPGQVTAWCSRGAGIGLAVGVGMSLLFAHGKKLDNVGLEDRAFRLLNNVKQNTMDAMATAGALGGAIAGALRVLPGTPPGLGMLPRVLRGASVGVACGSVAFMGFAASGVLDAAAKQDKAAVTKA
eukprot:jgi/Mesvir1/16390/Mv18131-RA.1